MVIGKPQHSTDFSAFHSPKNAGGRQLAARCCNVATFVCAGAKSEQWFTLGVECATKYFFKSDDATGRLRIKDTMSNLSN